MRKGPSAGSVGADGRHAQAAQTRSACAAARAAATYAVRVSGAFNTQELNVNGLYEVTEEVSGGMPVYKKQRDDMWLEYHVTDCRWLSRSTEFKSQAYGVCIAYVDCAIGTLPDKAPRGTWKVLVNDAFVDNASLIVTPMSAEEVKAEMAEVKRKAVELLEMIKAKKWPELMPLITCEAVREQEIIVLSQAVALKAPLEVLSCLLNAWPDVVGIESSTGYLPLHYAAYYNAPLAFVTELLAAYPQGAQIEAKNGALPLIIALEAKASIEVLSSLLEAYPDAVKKVNLFTLIEGRRWNVFVHLVSLIVPESAARKDQNGQLPLHAALEAGGAPVEVLSRLLAAFPDAANAKGKKGWQCYEGIPLHYASRHDSPIAFVKELLSAFRQGVQTKDTNGQLPLHLVRNLLTTKALLAAFRNGAKEKDNDGNTPLYTALKSSRPLEVIQTLLEAWPLAALSKNKNEQLPLHCAAQWKKAPVAFVEALLIAYPQSSREKDKDGHVPLAMACNYGASTEVLLTLLLADLPFAVDEQDGSLKAQEHGHSWTLIMDHAKLEIEQVKFLVTSVFDQLPSLAHHQLIHFKDARGREAISICVPEVGALMNAYIYFLGRYAITQGPLVHKSATAIVCYALDHSVEPPSSVALKFMKDKNQFVREILARSLGELDGAFVLEILQSYDSDELDQDYEQGLARLGLSEFRFCLVLPAADRCLDAIIRHDHIAARDYSAIRNYATQIARALEHLHSKMLIHGDVKPLNIMRVGERIKLIDLDASARAGFEFAANKWSSAYLPPELLEKTVDETGKECVSVRRDVLARISQDMWQFGCVLYHLCSGFKLWESDDQDGVKNETLSELLAWDTTRLQTKLANIIEKGKLNFEEAKAKGKQTSEEDAMRLPLFACSLCSQLLSKDPLKRPASMSHVLAHPFFTGRGNCRIPGRKPTYDVFISHRWFANDEEVELLYNTLLAKGLRVFLDNRELRGGDKWQEKFCNCLASSRIFVPILSSGAIKRQFESLVADSPCDNVLLEHRLAIELESRGMIETIFPVLIGDLDPDRPDTYFHFLDEKIAPGSNIQRCAPSPISQACVKSVEEKLLLRLESLSQGAPLRKSMTVKEVYDCINGFLGGLIAGAEPLQVMIHRAVDNIHAKLEELDKDEALSALNSFSFGIGGGTRRIRKKPPPPPPPFAMQQPDFSSKRMGGGGGGAGVSPLEEAIARAATAEAAKEEADARASAAEEALAALALELKELKQAIAASASP